MNVSRHRWQWVCIPLVTLFVCMIVTAPVLAFTKENADEQQAMADTSSTITINEYEEISNLAKQSTSELKNEGFSSQEIASIYSYRKEFKNHVEELNKMSDDALADSGYTLSQIEDIRNFDGSSATLARVSAKCSLNGKVDMIKYYDKHTHARITYNWSWSGIPVYKMTDMVAVGWGSWHLVSQSGSVVYYNLISGKLYKSANTTLVKSDQQSGKAHKFKMLIDDHYYAKKGAGSFSLRGTVQAKQDIDFYMEYGHMVIRVTPSVSFGISGIDPTIQFEKGVNTAAKDRGHAICP